MTEATHILREQGSAVARSAGIVIGDIQKLEQKHQFVREYKVASEKVGAEFKRLDQAVEKASNELQQEIEALSGLQHASDLTPILEAHRMMLHDPELLAATKRLVQDELINAEWALKKCLKRIVETFEQMIDPYLSSRKDDVEHIGQRIMSCLSGEVVLGDVGQSIMVAMDFSPADIVSMWRSGAAGFVSIQGGVNSHAMIVARGVGLPGIAGAQDFFELAEDGAPLILDAEKGLWILNPAPDDFEHYERFQDLLDEEQILLQDYAGQPSISQDGYVMPLMANIEFVEEIAVAQQLGVDGVGLFRTEFLFMNTTVLPTEEEQYQYYKQVVEGMQGKPVTFRLLDMGADKLTNIERLSGVADAENPALGLRGVRLLLNNLEVLKIQLRAIVRTLPLAGISILVPMVSTTQEMVSVRELLGQVKTELGVKKHIPLGCMIEVPAAVFVANELALVSDFFSIGSNDLMQYSLAVDRTDDNVSYLYDVHHPAVVFLIEMAAKAAQNHQIPISICGELAANPMWLQKFLDLKITSLSMSARHVLPLRKQLHQMRALP
ncbi:MAG: phosphoenolpyruvate--protein phosphotransferase [Ghiorsea sp.]